ncbi:hypothetical protein LTR97_010702 [Elasticomyces elasticus]|uniref:Fungal N-terminal domain-containing protein n=1 Tax=Elasticomyces elasticus TaxID=574655 RepID=A0AAN7VXL8_9PEZI|nr:hypothetical protein LTR97_010702 [Elasticomyces elasticus]
MADIAFGVIGIAGFAIQLAESIKKLQIFAAKVKNAQVELGELLENLEISVQWLDSISNAVNPATGIDPTLMAACEKLCRQAVERIKKIADELDELRQTKRRRTALRAAWTAPEMDRLWKKLEMSKADLHRAHSIYTAEQIRFENSDQGRKGRVEI